MDWVLGGNRCWVLVKKIIQQQNSGILEMKVPAIDTCIVKSIWHSSRIG